jgi:hypothetical protein
MASVDGDRGLILALWARATHDFLYGHDVEWSDEGDKAYDT